jgi:predicted protein tyrosine phosphatase
VKKHSTQKGPIIKMDFIKPRYNKSVAVDLVAKKLDIEFDKSSQDWAYEIADSNLIEKFYKVYDSLVNEDEKFVLMQTIIQATNDLIDATGKFDSWIWLEQRLIWDFKIHESTIDYWSCPDTLDINDCWIITHQIREILKKQISKKNVLFVCTINRMRSASANEIYKNDLRFNVKSAGTDSGAATVLTRDLLEWADSIIVMETHHRNSIRKHYPDLYKNKKIVCLYIPDDYDFMQPELISVLRHKFEDVYKRGLL